MSTVNISGLDRAAVLAALYNASKQQGMGFYDTRGAYDLNVDQAAEILTATPYGCFDYLRGRVMKVDLSGDDMDAWGYDRDNGEGAAARVIDRLRQADAAAA